MKTFIKVLILATLSFCAVTTAVAQTTITSMASGNWDQGSTWVGGVMPTSNDSVVIASGHIVTVNVNAAAAAIVIAANASGSSRNGIDINASCTLNVSRTVVMTSPTALTSEIRVGAGTFLAASISISGSATAGRNCEVSVSNGTITISGSITFSGTAAQARFVSTGASMVNIGGNFGSGGTLTTTGTGTINFNGAAAQTIGTYITYNNITINNTSGSVSFTGATTIGGTLTVTTGAINFGAFTTVVTGATYVSSTLNITSTTGTKTFSDIIINSGGVFNNSANEDVTVNGNIQNDGTFTAGTGVYTLIGTGKTISGINAVVIPSLTVNGTYTNNVSLTVNTTLAGSGTLTNGVSTTLNLGGTTTITTLNASANPNTVNYTSTTADQTVKSATYHHLTSNKTGRTATLGGAITVNGNLTVTNGTLADGGYAINGTGSGVLSVASGATLTLGTTTTATSFPTSFGTITLALTSTINYNSNLAQTISSVPVYGNLTLTATAAVIKTAEDNLTVNGALTIGANNTLADNNKTITVKGNITNSGVHSGTGKILLSGGTAVHTLSGTGSYTNLELNDVQGASMGASFNINGDLTITTGAYTIGAYTTIVAGATYVSGTLNIISTTGTKTFGDIIINSGGDYNNSANEAITINRNIQNDGTTFTAGTGIYTLDGTGKTISGLNAVTIPSLTVNGTYTNNIVLTVGTVLAGSGTLTNGTNATLNLGGTSTITTLDATANPNTVNYTSSTAAQTVKATAYHHLTINKSGQTATLGGAIIVNGNLTISAGTLADGGFQITGNSSGILTAGAGTTIMLGTITIATTFPTDFTAPKISLNLTSTVNYNSNLAQTISSVPVYGNLTLTATAGIIKTGNGDLTVNGNLTIGANNTLADGGWTITVKGNVTNNTNHTGTGKILLSGGSVTHTLSGTGSYTNLELNDIQGASMGASFTVNGNLILTLGTLTTGTNALTVNGTTTISGTLNISGATGVKTFNNITVNPGGIFNNSANFAVTVNGTIQSDGTFTAGTGVYTLTGTDKSISGVNEIAIPSLTVNGTYTNNGTLTDNTALSGIGTLTNGTGAALNIGGTSPITTLDATASGNTVSYTSTTAGQTVKGITYHNLIITKSAQIATLGGAITVNGNLTINSGILTDAGYQITGNATGTFTLGTGTTINLGTASAATLFPINFTSGNITLNPTNTVNYNSNLAQTISSVPVYGHLTLTSGAAITKTADGPITINGNLVIGANNTFDNGGYTITVKGNVTNSASFSGAGKILLGSGSATHTLTGGTYSNLELDDVQGASMSSTFTVSGKFSVLTGNFNALTRTLTVGGNFLVDGSISGTTGAITLNGSDKTIDGSGSISIPVTMSVGNKTITSSANLTFSNTLAISGAITIINNGIVTSTASTGITGSVAGSTWINGVNSTLVVAGPLLATGTLTANATGNTVNYNGTSLAQTIKGTTYHNLITDKSGQTGTIGAAAAVNNDLTITSGFLTVGAFAFFVNGTSDISGTLTISSATGVKSFNNIIINSGGVFDVTAPVNITINGNLENNGTFNANTGTYTFAGSEKTTKTIGGTSEIAIPNVNINGTYANNGIFSISTSFGGSGSLINATDATLNIGAGGVTPTLNASANNNTVNYNASGGQTVKPTTYYDLTLSGSGIKTTNDVTVNNGLSVQGSANASVAPTYGGGAFLEYNGTQAHVTGYEFPQSTDIDVIINNPNGVTLNQNKTLYGTLILRNGPLSIGPNLLNIFGVISREAGSLNGGSSSSMKISPSDVPTVLPSVTLNSLAMNRSAGINLGGNVTIIGTLSLQSGVITTGAYKVILTSSASVARTNGYVNGNLEKYIATGETTKTFEIGDANNYTPIEVAFGNVTTSGYLTAISIHGDHPDIVASLINPEKSVNRYWTLTNAGVGFDSYNATFFFVPSDVDASADPDTFVIAKKNITWTRPTVGVRTSTSTQAIGLTEFCDFAIGEFMTYTITTTIVGHGIVTRLPDHTYYNHGTLVQLNAIPDDGWHFVGWSGDTICTNNPITITVNSNKNITATFADNTPPNVPILIAPANNLTIAYRTPTFIWHKVSDAERYRIVVTGPEGISEVVVDTTYIHSDNLSDGEYHWKVQAQDSTGNWGGYSSEWTLTIDTQGPVDPVLTLPTNGSTFNDQTPTFVWNTVTDAVRYNLIVEGAKTVVIDETLDFITTFTPTTELDEGTYSWKVKGCDVLGNWGEYSTLSFTFTIDITGPSAPTLISPIDSANISTETTTLLWNDVADRDSFHIVCGISDADYYAVDTTITITLGRGTYDWKVQARDVYGNWGPYFDLGTFIVTISWVQKESIPNFIKDGGALVKVSGEKLGDVLYAFRGTKTKDFYMYDGAWTPKDTIPFGYKPPELVKINKKYPGKGAALCFDDDHTIYATKGNGTWEFWAYDLTSDAGWTAKSFIPSTQKIKGGTSMAYYGGKVYLLAGAQKKDNLNNFFAYNPAADSDLGTPWTTLAGAPIIPPSTGKAKPFKDGSAISVIGNTIYALKGGDKYNFFYAYDIAGDTALGAPPWTEIESIPRIHPVLGKKNKVGDGGAMTTDGTILYVIKGKGKQDFWSYTPGAKGVWTALDTIPRVGVAFKKSVPKTGAALAFANGAVWLLKGNKTPEFWKYVPSAPPLARTIPSIITSVMTEKTLTAGAFAFDVTPNPFTKLTTIRYTVPVSGKVSVKLYNATGRLIETLVNDNLNAGTYTTRLSANSLAKGIYFLKYESNTNKSVMRSANERSEVVLKLIVQ